MTSRPPPAPADLNDRGAKFWRTVVRDYALNVDEMQVLLEACRCMDNLERMREVVNARGVTVAGSKGQTRAHPLLADIRATVQLLSKLLAQLQLPNPEEPGRALPSPRQAGAKRAAGVRWFNEGGRRGTAASAND